MQLKKFLAVAFAAGCLTFTPEICSLSSLPAVHAEVKMYTGIGESQMSEVETADIVKLRAKEKAIQNATKQAGVVLLSYSRTVNSELTDDEISAITSTKYKTVGEPAYERVIKQITDTTTAIVWRATVKVNVDDKEIQNWLKLDAAKKAELIAQNKSDNTSFAENDRRAEALREQYLNAKTDADKARIKAELEQTDREFLEVLAVKKFRQGNFLSTSDMYASEAAYTEAIELVPNYALAYFHRGRLYFHDFEDKKRALDDFTKVIELQPKNAEAYRERGGVYASLEDYKEDLKYFKLAIADYDKAIELNPNDSAAYGSRGHTYYLMKEHEKAIKDYDKAIRLCSFEPERVLYYDSRGEAYAKLKDYTRAIKDFTSAIKIVPTEITYYKSRGECYVNMGDYKAALQDYTTAIEIQPDFSLNYSYRGGVYFLMKEYNHALEDYSKAIKLEPDYKSYYESRAKVYEALGRHEEAQADLAKTDKNWRYDESQSDDSDSEKRQYSIEDLTEMINSNPNNADAYLNRGNIYRKSDDHEKAIADYSKAIELNPKNSVACNNRGLVYYKMKNYKSAMKDYNQAIKLNPKYADAYCNRGLVWHKLKEYRKAIEDYTKAIEINPAKKKFYKCRANSYLRLNDMDKYSEDLARC